MNTNSDWLFPDDPATPCVTTIHVTDGSSTIVSVCRARDDDGELTWQFHSAEPFKMKDAQLVRLDTILSIDPSMHELADLPLGFEATRTSANARWNRHPIGSTF